MKTLLVSLLLLLASVAQAATWTCTKDFSTVQLNYYETVGSCAVSGSYTTGGDPVGASATGSATAQAVCGSQAQILVDLLITPSTDGALTNGPIFTFDHTNFKVQALCASPCAFQQTLTAGAATCNTGCCTTVNAASLVFCTDQTAAATVKCTPGSGSITLAGTGTDAISVAVLPNGNGVLGECTTGASLANQKFRFRAVCK